MKAWTTAYRDDLRTEFKELTKTVPARLRQVTEARTTPTLDGLPIGSGRKLDAAVMFFDIEGFTKRTALRQPAHLQDGHSDGNVRSSPQFFGGGRDARKHRLPTSGDGRDEQIFVGHNVYRFASAARQQSSMLPATPGEASWNWIYRGTTNRYWVWHFSEVRPAPFDWAGIAALASWVNPAPPAIPPRPLTLGDLMRPRR